MDQVQFIERPELRDPILLLAFTGWGDASEVATWSAKYMVKEWDAPKLAEIDPEEFFVFTDTRPQSKWVNDQRTILWPATEFYYHKMPDQAHDFIVGIGTEPNLRWKAFLAAMMSVIRETKTTAVITLGGLLAAVPHTHPARLTGTATEPDLAEKLHSLTPRQGRYEGPTGIVGVLNTVLQAEDVPYASLWGNVPHYLAATPNIKVALGMLRQLNRGLSLGLSLSRVERQAVRFETQVNEAVADNSEITTYVRKLEAEHGLPGPEDPPAPIMPREELPSSDVLLADLENYLRRQRTDGDPEDNGPKDPHV
ncbi:MAG: PAC2 family protein [Dehalococcoidia bacterium]|nr:PAC2 family protein [Dehalococcoidia bacterium]